MIFERAVEKDIKQIHALIEMCYRGEFAKKGWTFESDLIDGIRITEEALREEMNAGSFLIHSDREGKVIGCIYTRVNPEEKTLYVGMLSVHPLFQSKGLGSKLMAEAEAVAKNEGCTKLIIKVITRRKELIEWYEMQGFKSFGEVTPFISEDGAIGIPKVAIEFCTMAKVLE